MAKAKQPSAGESLRTAAIRLSLPHGGRCWVRHGLPKALLPEVNAILRDSTIPVTALARALTARKVVGVTAEKLRHHRNEHLLKGQPCP